MTLPSTGSISMSQVNTELGNASNAQLSMGSAAVRALFGVPTGAISMSNGWGKSSRSYSLAFSVYGVMGLGNANAGMTFYTDGTAREKSNSVMSAHTNWTTPGSTGIGSSYWIRRVLTSGSAPTGLANNVWTSLSSAQSLTISTTSGQTKNSSGTLALATDSGGTNIVATGTYYLDSDSS
jgi:hypothetical protein